MVSLNIQLFQEVISNENSVRKSAEEKLDSLKKLPFTQSVPIFLEAMNHSDSNIANLSAILLKKKLIDDSEYFNQIPKESLTEFIKILIQLINFDREKKFLHKIADILSKISFYINNLQEIFPKILEWFNDQRASSREFSIYLIEVLCENNAIKDDIVSNSITEFNSLFNKGLTDSDVNVRISTLNATTQFYSKLKTEDIVEKFANIIDNTIDSLVYVLKNDESSGRIALESLNNLTESYPKLWKNHVEVLISVICEILKQTSFSFITRESALEIILTLANKTPAFLRKSENFKNLYLPLVFELLLDIDHVNDVDAWNKDTDENDNEKEQMHFVARDALERLSIDLGGVSFLNLSDNLIKNLLSSDNWIHVHAGLISIGWIAEGCKENFKKNHETLLEFVIKGLSHTHPRVRWASLTTLGALLSELAPLLQKKFHQDLLPCIIGKINNDQQYLRILTQSTSCFVSFLRGLLNKEQDEEEATELLLPYAKQLLDTLSQLFNASLKLNHFPLQEESLSSLSLLATILDKDFADYYPLIMPGLKQIIQDQSIVSTELKSHAIQTIGYLISSVSDQSSNFIGDFKEILNYFIKILVNLPEEDSQVPAIISSFIHISSALKDQFLEYLAVLFPILERYIKADIDFKLEDADLSDFRKDNKSEASDSITLKLQGIGNKKLSVKTYTLQNKIMAVEVMHDIAINMGKSFNPFLEQYLKISKDLLRFAYSRKIRKFSIDSLKSCILCCNDENQIKTVLDFMFPEILALFDYNIKHKLLKEIKSTLKALINSVPLIRNKNLIEQSFIRDIYQYLKEVIILVEELKLTVSKNQPSQVSEGYDEKEDESIKTDINVLNELNRRIMELNGIIFKLFENDENVTQFLIEALEPYFDKIWTNSITKTKNESEILYSVCYFSDVLKFSKLETFYRVYPKFIEYSTKFNTNNQDIVQSVVWGFGEIARRISKSDFHLVKETVLNTINFLLNKKDANSEDNAFTTDNAISSLTKYVLYQCENDNFGLEIAAKLLEKLPLKIDVTEGNEVCKLLFSEFLNKHPLICNPVLIEKIKNVIQEIEKIRKDDGEFLEEDVLVLYIQVLNSLGLKF